MIKIEKIDVWGFEHAIRGMRNPLESHNRSDSEYGCGVGLCSKCNDKFRCESEGINYVVGKNDLALMQALYKAGTEHRKYLRQIGVSMDITAPLYFYLEFDTYKIGVTSDSCSKMHKLLSKPFEMSDFSFDKIPGCKNEVKQFRPIVDESVEEWRIIPDTEYMVSSEGRVKHNNRILAGSVHDDGYIWFTIKGKQYGGHRLVATAFIENAYNKPFVNHIDGNKMNNQSSNLEWVTQKENAEHARKNRLQPNAVKTYRGKFTDKQREKIKQDWNSGLYSKRKLAVMYGVSYTCICDIINEKYKYADKVNVFEEVARPLVDTLNELRDMWLRECDNDKKKQIWYTIIQLLPESYNQRRTITMNYENVMNIINQREYHKLDEWRKLVSEFKKLPYVAEIRNDV